MPTAVKDPCTLPPQWVLEDVIDGFGNIEKARELRASTSE